MRVRLLVVALVATTLVGVGARAEAASDGTTSKKGKTAVSVPTVTGPVTGGKGVPNLVGPSFDLTPFGYVQEEYLFAGNASAYTSAQPLTPDGKWTVTPASTAPYATRMVVIRPAKARDFHGTVVVEWLNDSAGFDVGASYTLAHLEMLRAGMAWVGVSAQAVGVQGGQSILGAAAPGGLKGADPERYGTLTHPGDSYSYDIYSQAGAAVRGEAPVQPLGNLVAKRVIAAGESQSASRLVTYVDGVQPLAHVYDGFMVHSRPGGAAAALSQAPLPTIPVPGGTLIRADVTDPVFVFLTETDVGPLGAAAARQPDTKHVRTWEVAGASHADAYVGGLGFGDVGDGKAELALLDMTKPSYGPLSCGTPINMGPHYAVLMAAYSHLDRWVRTGSPPPTAAPLEVTPGPGRTSGGVIVPNFVVTRDEYGNARGGIRTPFVDAPRAAITGELNNGGTFCFLFGHTDPFDAARIAKLYPTKDAFLAEFERSTKQAQKAGFVLKEEADKWHTAIAQVPYPG